MKRVAFLLSFFFFFTNLAFSLDSGYEITDYNFDAVVHENSVVSVTETINVFFKEERHGIVREIPLKAPVWRKVRGHTREKIYYDTIENIRVKSKYQTLTLKEGVKRGTVLAKVFMQSRMTEEDEKVLGKDYFDISKYVIVEDHETNDEFYRYIEKYICYIKIGSYSTTVMGPVQYIISYDLSIPDDKIKTGDIFYFSVLGSDWDTNIKKFTYNITFEKPFPKDTGFFVKSGSYGATYNRLNVSCDVDGNKISGSVLNVGEKQAVTIFAELPEGYYVGARVEPVRLSGILPYISIIFSLIIIARALMVKTKLPVQTIEFYPPEGITSADVGMIVDNKADSEDILTLIPYWGSRGLIKIKEKGSYLEISKLKELYEGANSYEKTLWRALFEKEKNKASLKNVSEKFVSNVNTAVSDLARKFTRKKALFETSETASFFFIMNELCFLVSYIAFQPDYFSSHVFLILLIMAVITFISVKIDKGISEVIFRRNYVHKKNMILFVLSAILLCAMTFLSWNDDVNYPFARIFFASLALCLAGVLKTRFIKATDYNIEISGKLLGLKDFIEKAELEKLKALMNEDPEYFYNILPFAIAFGLEDKWIEKFIPLPEIQPDWYEGTGKETYSYSTRKFNRMVNSRIRELYSKKVDEINSANSSSCSSISSTRSSFHSFGHFSGGGHGFSGGGHGGGGGHSW